MNRPPRPGEGEREGEAAGTLALVGPTATGKTSLAIAVGRRLEIEVVSLDSRQAYRGLEVGTAAPTAQERASVPHHGVAFLVPGERYSAGRFARLARRWIAEIRTRGRVPFLCGGTGFFLEALTNPVFREPRFDEERRAALHHRLAARSAERLEAWARRLDPELFRRLRTVDPQRAARTLELALLTGRPVTWWQDHAAPEAPPLRPLVFVLELPAAVHRERIARRAERQLEGGWLEEARRLRAAGLEAAVGLEAAAALEGAVALEAAAGLDAVGYRHLFGLLDGELDRKAALGRIVADTWSYARRQRTWFRNRAPSGARRLDATRPTGQLAAQIVEAWHAAEAKREEAAPSSAVAGEEGREGVGG